MNIVAAVCYFDEPLAHTDRLLESLVGVASHVVVLDGAYRLFPHDRPFTEQKILAQIHGYGQTLGFDIHISSRVEPWENQTVKRTRMMNIAASMGDYVLIIDADEWIDHEYTDVEKLVYKLEKHQPDAVAVCLDTPEAPVRSRQSLHNLGTQSPKMSTSQHGRGIERIYRALDDFLIGPQYHGSVSATNELGERLGLRVRNRENITLASPVRLDAKDYVRIVNGTWDRDTDRLKKKNEYGTQRKRHREDK